MCLNCVSISVKLNVNNVTIVTPSCAQFPPHKQGPVRSHATHTLFQLPGRPCVYCLMCL